MNNLIQKAHLNISEEVFRVLQTMMKRIRANKKSENTLIAETVADVSWIHQIKGYDPMKYSIVLRGDEEAAKAIFYLVPNSIVLYDLYVSPRFRKQGLAKRLLVEILNDNIHAPVIMFHVRESNKPVHNMVKFFVKTYDIDEGMVVIEERKSYYVDGSNSVVYTIPNPTHLMALREKEEEIEEVS